jgi:hypothetical protein
VSASPLPGPSTYYRPHPELTTGVADPQRMKRVVRWAAVGMEVGNLLGAC